MVLITSNNIAAYRVHYGLSQSDLARSIGISRQAVSNFENGKIHPKLETLLLMSEILNTNVNSLYNYNFENESYLPSSLST